MTEALFHLIAYLAVGGLITIYLRLVGIPALGHTHDCYASDRGYERIIARSITPDGQECYAWLGGTEFQLGFWIAWTLIWPIVIVIMMLFVIGWIGSHIGEYLGKIFSVKF